tara:strand:+ start:7081 stop:7560 length:480 start_codon:yes stop_codon:yes gene_type:complete
MTKEEKALVMQLMGQTYGQIKQNDSMIVGSSGNLQPGSEVIKQQVEQLMAQPTQPTQPVQQAQQAQQAQQVQQPVQQAPSEPPKEVSHQQAAQELIQLEQARQAETISEEKDQLEFDLREPEKIDKLIQAVDLNRLLLKEIKLLLEKNGRKNASNKKPG